LISKRQVKRIGSSLFHKNNGQRRYKYIVLEREQSNFVN